MSSWTDADIREFEAGLPPALQIAKEATTTKVLVNINLTLETDKALDQLAAQCSVGRSEVVRQAITLVGVLLRAPYSEHELDAWHAIRALRAQLGNQGEYKKEYPRG